MNLRKQFSAVAAVAMLLGTVAPALAASGPTQAKPGTQQPQRALNYEAAWVSQTQAGTSNEFFNVRPGDRVTVTVEFENTGTESWVPAPEDRQVCIATYKDLSDSYLSAPSSTGYDDPSSGDFGRSYFRTSAWESDYRIGCIEETEVMPGEVGTFVLEFLIPSDTPTGMYREDISVASGEYWIENPTNGDPLGIAHIWVGFNVEDMPGGPEANIGIECFDNTLVTEQSTACVALLTDKFEDPIEFYDTNDLYLEFLRGSGQFFDADTVTAGVQNIIALDDTIAPGVYPFGVKGGVLEETMTLRLTTLATIPQETTTFSIVVDNDNLGVSIFPEVLTAGSEEEALVVVKLLDSNGDPKTGKAADLDAQVVAGDGTLLQFDTTTLLNPTSAPFEEVAAGGEGTGIYLAKLQVGTSLGEIRVRVQDLQTGAEETVSVQAAPPQVEVVAFPDTIFSNRDAANGASTIYMIFKDGRGKPVPKNALTANSVDDRFEVRPLLNLTGAEMVCATTVGTTPEILNAGNFEVLACQYVAPSGDDKLTSAKVVPVRIRDRQTGLSTQVNIQVNVGNNQSNGYANSMDAIFAPDQINTADEVGAIFVHLQDVKGNPISGDAAFIDIEDPYTTTPTELALANVDALPTGVYISELVAGGFDKGEPQGEQEEVDVEYDDGDEIDFEQQFVVEVFDYSVAAEAFPASISLGETTTLITTVADVFGGPAGAPAITPAYADFTYATASNVDAATASDVDAPAAHASMGAFGTFFVSLEQDPNDDDDIEVELDLENANLDDEMDIIIPVDADNSMNLTAFPERIAKGSNGSIIMHLKDQSGSPIDLDNDSVDSAATSANVVLDIDSDEDDTFSFTEASTLDGDGYLLNQMFEIQLRDNGTVLELDFGQDDGAPSLDEAANTRTGGIYVIPYVAPIDIDTNVSDTVEIEYEGVEDLTGTVTFNVFR